jgi:uncharacterized protein (DUF1499 family)
MTAILVIVLLGVGGVLLFRQQLVENASPRPQNLGVTDGRFAACPSSPNCVSSQAATDDSHHIEPIQFSGDPAAAYQTLLNIVQEMPRTDVIETVEGEYIYAETRSNFWGFIDDLEIYIDADENLIHMRSAARLGQSDMNVNRQRTQQIRQQFTEATS